MTLPLLKFVELGYGLGIFVQGPPLGFDHKPVGSRLLLLLRGLFAPSNPPLFPPSSVPGFWSACGFRASLTFPTGPEGGLWLLP